MKYLLFFFVFLFSFELKAQVDPELTERFNAAIKKYNYPLVDNHITYTAEISAPELSKSRLYKRALQFIQSQEFDRTVIITSKKEEKFSTKLFDHSILFSDEEEGKITGNGFFPFTIVISHPYYYTLTFKYKIWTKDGKLKYEFSNFQVLQFLRAPKARSRGGSYSGFTAIYSVNNSTVTMEAEKLRTFPLEEFITKGYFQDDEAGSSLFQKSIDKLLLDLKNAINDNY